MYSLRKVVHGVCPDWDEISVSPQPVQRHDSASPGLHGVKFCRALKSPDILILSLSQFEVSRVLLYCFSMLS